MNHFGVGVVGGTGGGSSVPPNVESKLGIEPPPKVTDPLEKTKGVDSTTMGEGKVDWQIVTGKALHGTSKEV